MKKSAVMIACLLAAGSITFGQDKKEKVPPPPPPAKTASVKAPTQFIDSIAPVNPGPRQQILTTKKDSLVSPPPPPPLPPSPPPKKHSHAPALVHS